MSASTAREPRSGHPGSGRTSLLRSRDDETRREILDTAQRLLERNGSVKIRDLVAESGLARATLYRRFESLDHVIVELQIRWIEHLEQTFVCSSSDPSDRLLAVVEATWQSLASAPRVARAAFRSRHTDNPGVQSTCEDLDRRVDAFLRSIVADDEWMVARVCAPLRLAWYGALSQWSQRLLSAEEVKLELEGVVRLLVAGAVASA